MIIALAGHVDHGKTSLIRALTGIDPDRLPEERRRGMTIDLGFAYARTPEGGLLGFVDVPGHERFFGTALAGLLNAGAALLVVAADDGPMPQTREHLEVLRLANVPRIIAAITKTDRVPPERTDAVMGEVAALLRGAGYPEAPVLPVSPVSGDGIARLRHFLEALERPPVASGRHFRFQVDRAFVLPGTGLVVTGAVAAGEVAPGEVLLLSPARLAVRVRGLQIAGAPALCAKAADRAALVLAGTRLERARIGRGDWLLAPALHAPTARLDIRLASTGAIRHGGQVLAHLGAAESPGRVLFLGGADLAPGNAGFARLLLQRPVAALHDDRLMLRAASTGRLAGGGRVIDPFPPARREPPAQRLSRLEAQAQSAPGPALDALLASQGAVDLAAFALARNLAQDEAASLALARGALVRGSAALSTSGASALRCRIAETLSRWHRDHPDRIGPPKPALLAAAAGNHPRAIAEAALADLLAEGVVVQDGAALRLPSHRPALRPEDEAQWTRLRPAFEAAGLRPPRMRELADLLGLTPEEADALLARLEHFGLLIRVAPNRLFLPETVDVLAGIARDLAARAPEHSFTAAEFNAGSGIGRNLTIQVLESLDRLGITKRFGEVRCMAS